ncbi:MAG: helix-hairpin-helix domain-containing protein [Eubacteriales bacterium]|nr:helix-hairpin-helix domain-containing protein [Eubacteriales bacterium]
MKTKSIGARLILAGRWAALGVLVLAAGCFYSCGSGQAQPVLTGMAEAARDAGEADQSGAGDGQEAEPVMTEPGQPAEPETEQEEPGRMPEEPRAVFYVYVCGEVASPGVYELTEGQRVYEAVSLAGGFTDSAAEDWLNLAEPVYDGMKIQIPDQKQIAEGAVYGMDAGGAGGAADRTEQKINLNTASREELMTLTGIGQSRAEDIIRYRTKQGGFRRIEDIMEVSGIKEASFEKIKDRITV